MRSERGTIWRRPRPRAALLALGMLAPALATVGLSRPTRLSVLVQADSTDRAASAVLSVHGEIVDRLAVVEGVIAEVPADRITSMRSQPGVITVSTDADASLAAILPGTTYDTASQSGSLYNTAKLVGADLMWAQGKTGSNVGIALIDSGVQANATYFGSRLYAGADYSGGTNALSDGFGHGTHMAGIIAGSTGTIGAESSFTGIAPRASLYSVKVADASGSTSLNKILLGMDWVYKNAATKGIRVVNLSLGAAAYDDYRYDPLAAAAERLWNNGITVVSSAGNLGPARNVVSPAYDPRVIAVGALDTKGTPDPADDGPAPFTAGASDWSRRLPDLLAPGRSIQSLLASGSTLATLAQATPGATIGSTFVKGSGTSQAAAVVTGMVALMIQANAAQKPDDVKTNLLTLSTWGGWDQLNGRQRAQFPAWTSATTSFPTGAPAQTAAAATAAVLNANESNDNATRNTSTQGSLWLGSTWSGSTWSGSTWSGSTWSGSLWMGGLG